MYEIEQRLARIEAVLDRLETRLLGNGQPGELDKLDARIAPLENVAARARGAFWAISGLLTLITGGGLLHIFGKPK